MNLTDLRDELDLRTADVQADPSSIAKGVKGRIRATRRRRVAGVAGGLGAAALALGLVLTNQASPVTPSPIPAATLGSDGMPSRAVPDAPGDVVKDGLRYRARVAEDGLAVGVIGDAGGQRSLTATWTPRTTHVSYLAECWLLPGTSQAVVEDTMVRASISGVEGHTESTCETRVPTNGDLSTDGYVPGEPGQGHPELQVGRTTTLTVELVRRDGTPAAIPGARLAAAVYDLGPQRLIEDDGGRIVAALPEVREHQGYTYRLEALVSGPVGTGALPEVSTPGDVPFLLTYGSTTPAGDPGAGSLFLVGLDEESSRIQGGGWSTLPQPAKVAGTVGLQSEGPRPKAGVAFIAIYRPAD
jgi:hypothetical protein